MQKKRTSPVFWLALIGLAVATYVLTTPEETGKKPTSSRTTSKKKAADSLFTEEDYKAKFEPLNTQPKNAFMPIVMRRDGSSSGSAGIPNALPTELTGGEGGWLYTGTAEVDGRIQAVVENQSTGQGDFLSVGQHWKKARVVAVTDSSLVLEGATGLQVTIKMQERLSTGSVMAGGFAPVNVPPSSLRGPIGPLSVTPDRNTQVPQQIPLQTEGDSNAN